MLTTRTMKRTIAYLLFIVTPFMLFHCTGLITTRIGDIRNSPRDYVDKEVTVSGAVTGVFSLVVVKYFTIRDRTGEIAVVTHGPLPKEGERLKVRGIVREAFSIGSESLLVIVEKPKGENQETQSPS